MLERFSAELGRKCVQGDARHSLGMGVWFHWRPRHGGTASWWQWLKNKKTHAIFKKKRHSCVNDVRNSIQSLFIYLVYHYNARTWQQQQRQQEPRRDCETTMDSSVTNGYSRSVHERTWKRKMTLVSCEFRTIIISTIHYYVLMIFEFHLIASNKWYWHWRPVASLSPPKALQRSSLYHERTQGWLAAIGHFRRAGGEWCS
jgi:hypothetical protein